MTDYYISAAGDDANDGSSAHPWKTLDKVNSILASAGVGNRFLFHRGDTFYGKIRPRSNIDYTKPGWLKFGAYGDDPAKPVISGYKVLNTASGWVQHDADTWKIDLSPANVGTTYTGFGATPENHGDVGFIKVDNVIHGFNRIDLASMVNQWDYYTDIATNILYVRSTAKPTTLAGDIRCSVDVDGVYAWSAIEVANLNFTGYGSCGIYIARGGGGHRIRVIGNTVGEIGGSFLDVREGLLTGRYGNGITTWHTISDVHVEHNIVHDVYDTAWSIQGGTVGVANGGFTNVTWRRNLTYRCSQAEEYWYSGLGVGFDNCVSEYNTNLFCGYGFGAETRPDTAVRVGLLTYPWGDDGQSYVADLTLRRNIYYDCREGFSWHANAGIAGLQSDRNVIVLRPGTRMRANGADVTAIENAATWSSSVGREQHSLFGILPASSTTDISDAAATAAIADLDVRATTGQLAGGTRVFPIHQPWRTV